MMWIAICISCQNAYRNNTMYLGWISPIFTILLLTKVSGIPMLDAIANKKWGNDPNY